MPLLLSCLNFEKYQLGCCLGCSIALVYISGCHDNSDWSWAFLFFSFFISSISNLFSWDIHNQVGYMKAFALTDWCDLHNYQMYSKMQFISGIIRTVRVLNKMVLPHIIFLNWGFDVCCHMIRKCYSTITRHTLIRLTLFYFKHVQKQKHKLIA